MRIITHTSLVKRNVAIAKYGSLIGFVTLIGALLLNLYAFSQPTADQARLVTYVFGAFLIGYTLTTVGSSFQNRWARRPDQGLALGLRGLDQRHALYNYRLGAAHVLVGPGGVFVLHPKYQGGAIAFENGKWSNPGARRGFLSLFARDALGNPSGEAAYEVEQFNRFLTKHAPENTAVPQPVIVFMNPHAVISAKESPVPAVHVKQLKDYIRKAPKSPTLPAQALAEIEQKLGLVSESDSEGA
jgi:hypothetical protein